MAVRSVALFSPAKINLFLAVTGRRPDGFHDLVSLVAPVMFGDTIWLHQQPQPGAISFTCDDPAVPHDAGNLAIRAAELFREATQSDRAIRIELRKRIPLGAGLGGGSSNASAVLRGLNALAPRPIDAEVLAQLAGSIGSDCPLFLADGPCVIRGRGERITPVSADVHARLRGRRVRLFKPDFAIRTQWAYEQLTPASYVAPQEAETRLSNWLRSDSGPAAILFNSFEAVVCRKFLALAELLESTRHQARVAGALLSGSGSASFALLDANESGPDAVDDLRAALGPGAFVADTIIA